MFFFFKYFEIIYTNNKQIGCFNLPIKDVINKN